MLFFVGTRFHQYTLSAPVETGCGGHGVWIVPVSYDDLFAATELPGGTYVFTDIERLSPHERLLAAAIYRALAAHPAVWPPGTHPAPGRGRRARGPGGAAPPRGRRRAAAPPSRTTSTMRWRRCRWS